MSHRRVKDTKVSRKSGKCEKELEMWAVKHESAWKYYNLKETNVCTSDTQPVIINLATPANKKMKSKRLIKLNTEHRSPQISPNDTSEPLHNIKHTKNDKCIAYEIVK